jgi:hypothetical protein
MSKLGTDITEAERGNGSSGGGFGMQKESWTARCVRWSYELLLSLYYVLLLLVNTSTFGNLEVRVRRLPPELLRLTSHLYWSNPVESIEYLTWFLIAGIVFAILRIMGQIRPLRAVLCQLVGSVVFLVPLVRMMPPLGATMPSWWMWLWVEGTVASGAALLYANRTRPATAVFLAVISLLHFGLWSFVYFRNVRLVGVIETIAEWVLLPLFGTLAWASYVWLLPRPTRHK